MEPSSFAKNLSDEELSECVTYLTTSDTNLPCDIIVDCGETYKYYHHCLCLYMVNDDETVTPISISQNPEVLSEEDCTIPQEIIGFIQQNYSILHQFADMKISGPMFFDYVKEFKDNIAK